MRLLTTDIYEGAYLLSQGIHLEKLWLRGNNGKRSVVFEFSGIEAELLRKHYQDGKAETNVIRLRQSLNELKDRMFSILRENRLREGVNHEPIHRTGVIGIKETKSN